MPGGAAPVVERVHAQLRRTPTAALWADSADVWYALGNILYREGRAVHALSTGGAASTDAPEVWAALVDREGSVWLGTQASGLHRLTRAVFRVYGTPEGMGGNNVYPIAEDGNGGFWLGTWGTGVSRLDPATGSVSNHGAPDGVPPFVQTILDDGPGRLLLGAGDGLRVCDVGARLTCRIAGPPALQQSSITALFRDDAGAVWAAGPEGIHRRVSGVWRRVASPVSNQVARNTTCYWRERRGSTAPAGQSSGAHDGRAAIFPHS